MKSGGKVSIDIANASQSVTKSVKALIEDDPTIKPDEVELLRNGWVRLTKGESNLYISPHAIESILVEGGELELEA